MKEMKRIKSVYIIEHDACSMLLPECSDEVRRTEFIIQNTENVSYASYIFISLSVCESVSFCISWNHDYVWNFFCSFALFDFIFIFFWLFGLLLLLRVYMFYSAFYPPIGAIMLKFPIAHILFKWIFMHVSANRWEF